MVMFGSERANALSSWLVIFMFRLLLHALRNCSQFFSVALANGIFPSNANPADIPITFCSAIPHCITLLGLSSANCFTFAVESALITTTSSFCLPSSTSASPYPSIVVFILIVFRGLVLLVRFFLVLLLALFRAIPVCFQQI